MSQPFLFDIPQSIEDYLVVLDDFIEREIKPLEAQDDNIRFFDHRREHARTDWDRDGLPREDWEALLIEMRRRADAADARFARAVGDGPRRRVLRRFECGRRAPAR